MFVGYGLLFQKRILRELLLLVWTGFVLADPLSALSTTFLRGCLSCFHFNSCAFFFIIVFVVPHVDERTHENMVTIENCLNLMLKIIAQIEGVQIPRQGFSQ